MTGLIVEDFFLPFFSPMPYAAAGGRQMKAIFVITVFAIRFNLKPVGEKTRGIASLQWRILIIPDLGVIIVVWSIDTFLSV